MDQIWIQNGPNRRDGAFSGRKRKVKAVINTWGMYKTWKMINRPGI